MTIIIATVYEEPVGRIPMHTKFTCKCSWWPLSNHKLLGKYVPFQAEILLHFLNLHEH